MEKESLIEFPVHVADAVNKIIGLQRYDFILIGAAARDTLLELHGLRADRATRDVEFGVFVRDWSVFIAVKQELLEQGFTATSEAFRFRFNRLIIDLIPFGDIETAQGEIIWPGDSRVMNMSGFHEVYQTAHRFRIAGTNREIKIATIAGLVLLKFVSWNDRPLERAQDPLDITTLLRKYLDAGNLQRFYAEHSDLIERDRFTWEAAGAALAARDIRMIANQRSLRLVINTIKTALNQDEQSLFLQQMSRSHSFMENKDMLKAFLSEL